jgi:hypothetical protein
MKQYINNERIDEVPDILHFVSQIHPAHNPIEPRRISQHARKKEESHT